MAEKIFTSRLDSFPCPTPQKRTIFDNNVFSQPGYYDTRTESIEGLVIMGGERLHFLQTHSQAWIQGGGEAGAPPKALRERPSGGGATIWPNNCRNIIKTGLKYMKIT